MDISSDLGYCRTMDSGMAFGGSPCLEDTTTPGDSLVISISTATVAAQLSDTHIATGSSLGPGHLCGLRREHCPQTSIQTPAVVGSQTQTWFQAAAQVLMSTWPQVAA